ncbi:MAG: hypothetical protein QME77_11095 [bacterium]|nr:hypothetical protein [bacterium]
MRRILGDVLYVVDPSRPDASYACYNAKLARDLGLNESWFRDAIAACPDLVIAPCKQAGITDEDWYCWGREVSVEVGSIDVLLISESGRVAIVETKLAYNPERRRAVLAQLMEYAVHLRGMEPAELGPIPEGMVDIDQVRDHLEVGDFLLIVAGDALDPRAIRLSKALLAEHLVNPWDLAMIDLSLYQTQNDEKDPKYLLVPALRQAYEAEKRHVVTISVTGEPLRTVIRVESRPPEPPDGPRQTWQRQDFEEHLAAGTHLAPAFKELAGEVLKLLDSPHPSHSSVEASWGTGIAPALILKRNGNGLIELFPRGGSIRFRKDKFEAALGKDLGQSYLRSLERLFSSQMQMGYPYVRQEQLSETGRALARILREHIEAAERSGPSG